MRLFPDQARLAAADLDWPAAKYLEYRDKLQACGLIAFDADTDEIYIERWFKHHCKGSWKYAKSLRTLIDKIESARLKELADQDFMATPMGEAAIEANEAERASDRPSVANSSSRLLGTRLMQKGDPDAAIYRGVR
ncbi:hypothetical protein AJ88_27625 [Mesorhizobium amorphae CCBAU 01583]|nr:hypothetical protein AJ88_27625 [Mesorhizobium amorphae CCBAU 01583]